MGPISCHNITVAPAYYITQVDLAGPFKAYSGLNKRATLKIWLSVFYCAKRVLRALKLWTTIVLQPSYNRSADCHVTLGFQKSCKQMVEVN